VRGIGAGRSLRVPMLLRIPGGFGLRAVAVR